MLLGLYEALASHVRFWVISGHSAMSDQCPLYPRKQTLVVQFGWLLSGSAYSHAACSSVINMNSGFVGGDRAALHMIDEGS
jgi:hypothetical protein